MQLVVLDDLKDIQRIATGQRKAGSPPRLASKAGLHTGEPDSSALQNPTVGAAAGTVVRAVVEPDQGERWATVGHALPSAMCTRVGDLLRRSLY
jgi:hypothetical protein